MLSKLSSSPQAPFGEAPIAPESLFKGLLAPDTRDALRRLRLHAVQIAVARI